MGVDIHVKVLKYNEEDNLYHELKLYTKEKDEYKKVYIYNGRNSEMFDGLMNRNCEDGYGYFPASRVRLNSLEPTIRKEIEEAQNYCYGFSETTVADMKNYLNEHPEVIEYDTHWDEDDFNKPFEEKPHKTNPIKYLYDEICEYIRFADWTFEFTDRLSEYKIIFYFDC